jgi:hypothetical protein
MPGSGLISDYLAALSAELPGDIVAELADGLEQTYRHYLRQGLDPAAAAWAAVAEFGDPPTVIAAFIRSSPARRAARRLLATGPLAGGCWGAVLITGRAWAWPVPAIVLGLLGATLITVIGLLVAATFGRHYLPARRAGIAAAVGITMLDAVMLIGVPLVASALSWLLIAAAAVSMARISFTASSLRPILAR